MRLEVAVLTGMLLCIVLGAIVIDGFHRRSVPDTAIGLAFQRAIFFAKIGMFCFLAIPLAPLFVPDSQARLFTGAAADCCFVWCAACFDDFYWLIVHGSDHPLTQQYQRWKMRITLTLTGIVALLVLLAWHHGETENAARFYVNPGDDPFSISYRLLCQAYVGVCMIHSLRYGMRFRKISQDPISQQSVLMANWGQGCCLIAMGLGAWTLFTPAFGPIASPLLAVDRFFVLLFVAFTLAANRALCSHLWTIRAYGKLAPLWLTLEQPPAHAAQSTWQYAILWFRPQFMRIRLRQRVIAVLDARRRLGVVTTSNQPVAVAVMPGQTPWSEQYATGQAWLTTLSALAEQEAEHLRLALSLRTRDSAPIPLFRSPPIPSAPRAAVYYHEIVYLTLLAHLLVPQHTQDRHANTAKGAVLEPHHS